MKPCLILGAFLAIAAVATAAPVPGTRGQQVVDGKAGAPRVLPQAQPSAPVRHLNDQERAELRRQLQQFNQQYRRP
ncbi:hypothetical protein [Ramlibacter sp. PS4R-6]|uniref:hypothetical protein n=1 Tax=Ramlibacter sp. PS4R-6 TaxID=3133438 RepID=UPI0030B67F79